MDIIDQCAIAVRAAAHNEIDQTPTPWETVAEATKESYRLVVWTTLHALFMGLDTVEVDGEEAQYRSWVMGKGSNAVGFAQQRETMADAVVQSINDLRMKLDNER